MPKELSIILILSLSIIALSNPANSSVEGTWVIEGMQSLSVRIPGSRSTSEGDFVDQLTFGSDGSLRIMNWYGKGTWRQTKKQFTINLDLSNLGDYFESLFKALDYTVSVDVKESFFAGTERQDGTMKGVVFLNIDIHFIDLKKKGNMNIYAIFSGTKGTGGQTLSPGKGEPPQGTEFFRKVFGETLQGVIQAHDGAEP